MYRACFCSPCHTRIQKKRRTSGTFFRPNCLQMNGTEQQPDLTPTENKHSLFLPNEEEQKDNRPWYAMKLFTMRQKEIAEALHEKELEVFIPMEYADIEDHTNHVRHALRPVVHNLLFIKKTQDEKEIRKTILSLPYKVSIVKKEPDKQEYYEIPAKQMFEFQAMCNPNILMKQFVSEEQAKLKKGTPVIVTHGPLKGLKGKLVRADRKYYLLKEVPGIGVMLKVTKWCCKALEI